MTTQKPSRSWSWAPLLAAALLGCAGAGTEAGAQDVSRCEPVRAFLT
jgi:hypothetical protein